MKQYKLEIVCYRYICLIVGRVGHNFDGVESINAVFYSLPENYVI